jgi:uncharacterized phage infection (PIP) family protein YhgE
VKDMADSLDALTEQSVQRMLNLSASSDQVLSALTQTEMAITKITETIEASKQEAQTSFDNFGSKLDEAEQSLQAILQTTLGSLNALTDRATQLDEQTDTTANEIKTRLDEVKSFVEESVSNIQQQSEALQTELSGIVQSTEAFQTELVSQQETVTGSLEGFRAAVDSARQSFESSTENLTAQLTSFEQDIASKLTALIADIDGVLQEGDARLDSVQALLDSTSADILSSVETLFLQEFSSELSGASDVLNQGITLLKSTGVDQLDDFVGRFREILGKVDEVLDLFEEIKPVLEMVNEYL